MWTLVEMICEGVPEPFAVLKIFVFIFGWYLVFRIIDIPISFIKNVLKGFIR